MAKIMSSYHLDGEQYLQSIARTNRTQSCLRYTAQGLAKVKESPARLDAARRVAQSAGGKIDAWYPTMGKYGAVFVSEFPDDETCAESLFTMTPPPSNGQTEIIQVYFV